MMNLSKLIYEVYQLLHAIFYTFKNIGRDIQGLGTLTKVKRKLGYLDKTHINVSDYYARWLRVQPNKPCIIFNDTTWTFQDLENYGNKMANLFQKQGLKRGDVVALYMDNRPEYIGIWFGLSKLGVTTACINTNLRGHILAYSITVAKPKSLIYASDLATAVDQIRADLPKDMDYIIQGDADNLGMSESAADEKLENLLKPMSEIFTGSEKVTGNDVLMYIYTSGTTGMPKPAIIKHNRYIGGGFTFFDVCKLNTNDVFMVTLPIYHSNGGCIGVGAALISGATIVLRKKFSATHFWKDCIKYKVTAFSYVGEVCRYLVNQPPSALDKTHTVKKCIGNGTRANIHKEFTERFGVKVIELYAATEGNCVIVNNVAKLGACGYLPRINRYFQFLPTFIIKIDNDTFEPYQDKNGFCVPCDPGEKGLLVGLIDPTKTRQQYNGYANQTEATNKKIIKNLFSKGQTGFNTGDLVMYDNDGFIYFVDRLGDTFRWRGENVSTVEVENTISRLLNSTEVVVYGVEVNGQEGRAGMATIMSLDIDVKQLGEGLVNALPAYARPIFLRLNVNVDHTGSFKAQKTNLQKEAFNVNLFADKTYYFDSRAKCFLELTKEKYADIQDGSIRV